MFASLRGTEVVGKQYSELGLREASWTQKACNNKLLIVMWIGFVNPARIFAMRAGKRGAMGGHLIVDWFLEFSFLKLFLVTKNEVYWCTGYLTFNIRNWIEELQREEVWWWFLIRNDSLCQLINFVREIEIFLKHRSEDLVEGLFRFYFLPTPLSVGDTFWIQPEVGAGLEVRTSTS